MYQNYEKLLEMSGKKTADVCRATGISSGAMSDWKKGRSAPKAENLRKIADFFGVPVDYIINGEMPKEYYRSEETAEVAQKIFEDADMRLLFDAAKGSRPEDLRMAADFLKRLKETNPNG